MYFPNHVLYNMKILIFRKYFTVQNVRSLILIRDMGKGEIVVVGSEYLVHRKIQIVIILT